MSRVVLIESKKEEGKKGNPIICNFRGRLFKVTQSKRPIVLVRKDQSYDPPKMGEITEKERVSKKEAKKMIVAKRVGKSLNISKGESVQNSLDQEPGGKERLFFKASMLPQAIKNSHESFTKTRNKVDPGKSQSRGSKEDTRRGSKIPTSHKYSKIQDFTEHAAEPRPEERPANTDPPLSFPINPGKALKLFLNSLSDFEKGEILDFKHIYFLGQNAQKIPGFPRAPHNFGYDDERGDYNVVVHDHLAYRYEVIEILGKGSFGQVLKCLDHKRNELVALKIIRNKKRFHHQAVVEAKLLKYIRDNDPNERANIVKMTEFFIFRSHFCISFELLSINLYEFLKNGGFKGLSMGLIRRFAIQILHSLQMLSRHRIIHCDLKPENILLKQPTRSGIKVIDVGSGCFQNERIYTYILFQ